jgi:DNA-binding transcriptional MocR family regulator
MMVKITINRESGNPLYTQIRDIIAKAIQTGSLKPGDQLPPVTALAKDLGVTHATIRRAFKDLTKSGLIDSHVGRGTFVLNPNHGAKKEENLNFIPGQPFYHKPDKEFTLAARRFRMGITKSLDALMDLAKRPGLIQFTTGIPDPRIMEQGLLAELAKDALKAGQEPYQGYTESHQGMTALRHELAVRFTRDGMDITADHILVTNGSQQALSILAQAALENKQRIMCETPCFMGIPNAFGALGHWVEAVPRDWEGPMPDRLSRFNDQVPSFIYICPELHNPMGTDLSPDRQAQLIRWAKKQNVEIISDEIYHDLRFEGPSRKSVLTEAGESRTIVIGSLSKSFMVGLRIGWMISSPERIRSLVGFKRAMDLGCPPLMQGIALSLLKTGQYEEHLEKARTHYRIRRDTVIESLESEMPEGVTWTVPKGSIHMWVELPKGYSSIALFLHAIEKGVAIFPGPMQDVDHRFMNAFRLSYGSVNPEQIRKGIALLAEAIEELIKGPSSDPGLSGLGDFL